MTFTQAERYFGSKALMAKVLGRGLSTVYDWERDGHLPDGVQYQIEVATLGALRADKPARRNGDKR